LGVHDHDLDTGSRQIGDEFDTEPAVLMASTVLRPQVQVIARVSDPGMADRMRAFGSPAIINPFDSFGDHFRVELRAPAVERLAHWLMRAPGEPMPARHHAIEAGHWIVCGYGRFGVELVADLKAAGVEVVVVDTEPVQVEGVTVLRGDGTDPAVLDQARLPQAAGFVAGTQNDITNLSLVEVARRLNPSAFIVARQNQPMNAELFSAMDIDLTMVPSRVVAEESLAHVGTPRLAQFLQLLAGMDDAAAADLTTRIVAASGEGSPELWVVGLGTDQAPALLRAMRAEQVTVGDLVRDPLDREQTLPALTLMLARGDQTWLAPRNELALQPGDVLLFAGTARAQSDQQSIRVDDEATGYVLTGRNLPASWLLRTLQRTPRER
ncbi:MAG: potassium channel family protein, partial [Actinomycetales bacterium]